MIDIKRFESFVEHLRIYNPKFKLKYKDKSLLMRLLGYILFFNKGFMTTYTTTIGNTVYLPSKAYVIENPEATLRVVAHEYRHTYDANNISKLLFSIIYLSPQIFSLLTILFILLYGWWGLFGLIFFLPIPSYGRMRLELNGYTMSLFILHECLLEDQVDELNRELILKRAIDHINLEFTTSKYYFMWPFGVKEKLLPLVTNIIKRDIFIDSNYSRKGDWVYILAT